MPNLLALSILQVVGEPLVASAGLLTNLYCLCRLCGMGSEAKNAAVTTHKRALLWCSLNMLLAVLDQSALALIFGDLLGQNGLCRLITFLRSANVLLGTWMVAILFIIILSPYKRYPYAPHIVVSLALFTLLMEAAAPCRSLKMNPAMDLCVRNEESIILEFHFAFIDHTPLFLSTFLLILIGSSCRRKKTVQTYRLLSSLVSLYIYSSLVHLPFWLSSLSYLFFPRNLVFYSLLVDMVGSLVERLISWVLLPLIVVKVQARFIGLMNAVEDNTQDSQLVVVELEDLDQPTFNLPDLNNARTDL